MQSGPPFPFQPKASNNVATPGTQANIVTTTGVQQLNLPTGLTDAESTIRVVNDGADKIAWAYGNCSGLTVGNGVMMLPNTVETFMLPPNVTQISVIGLAGGSTFRVHVGDGV